ncbi:hypothetical protein JZM24_13960 [Candidatus Sodalis endolongispinus]|uniref:Uncharacterized protein n=1 Tax=Candidatus Sodalis endolongispinus TaxID=2812662 RepID=A0ABS5YDD2_9GAMM|nr:DUF6515 family protein [Candidatus Sodalis endolongispinus]MBT9432958.1 hypothetical protein [Candidatus Sodalis endolongispinus]
MRKLLVLLLSASLMAPAAVIAGPGGYHGGPGFGGPGWHGPGPGRGARFPFLPGAAETVLIAGLTYYVLNGIYYQRQNDQYVVVEPPSPPPRYVVAGNNSNMTVVDMNGERFYVIQGHYYRRNIDG